MQLQIMAQQKAAEQQRALMEKNKEDLAIRKQDFQEDELYNLKKMEAEARIRQNDERIADKRTSDADRIAMQRENNQIKMLLGQMMIAQRRDAADGKKSAGDLKLEQKLRQGLPQAKLRTQSMVQNLDRLDSAITDLSTDKGLPNITGTIAGRTPNLTNRATGAQAQLNSIKSQIFVSALQSMRESSKTGGAVGNVSNREGDKLEATLGALDQAQGTPDFKKQLTKVQEQIRLSKELINNAFEEQYGDIKAETSTKPSEAKRIKFDASGNMVK
jgi:hypothetical protein